MSSPSIKYICSDITIENLDNDDSLTQFMQTNNKTVSNNKKPMTAFQQKTAEIATTANSTNIAGNSILSGSAAISIQITNDRWAQPKTTVKVEKPKKKVPPLNLNLIRHSNAGNLTSRDMVKFTGLKEIPRNYQ